MPIKKAVYTYEGVNQDKSKSKHQFKYYFEAQHINILSTDSQSTQSLTNEKGNKIVMSLPDIFINQADSVIEYGTKTLSYSNGNEMDEQLNLSNPLLLPNSSNHKIIGHSITRNGIIIFSTDDNNMDCIWLLNSVLEDQYDLELLYLRNLRFSINDPIQAIFNYENENIEKVYWVDGKNQVRNLNIKYDTIEDNTDSLIDIPLTTLNFVGKVDYSQPYVDSIFTGGTHTSGMIQYAYNLYRINSSQTKISPLSELVAIDKGEGNGGGVLNEILTRSLNVKINNIDTTYTHIKVYAIKYTSFNELPSISLIEDSRLTSDSISIYDDGSIISSLTLDEFLFLGSDPVVPRHIETKDSRMLLANLQTKEFVLPDTFDSRAYGHNHLRQCNVWSDVYVNNNGVPQGSIQPINTSNYILSPLHDAINPNYNSYKYQEDGNTLGGEGKFIKYELSQKTEAELVNPNEYTLFKDREIYRIGIQLYNDIGQISLPNWIADLKAPIGNLQGNYNTLKIELKPEFFAWLNDNSNFEDDSQKPIGFKIIRADRTEIDKTIICQGITNGMIVNTGQTDVRFLSINEKRAISNSRDKRPSPFIRTFQNLLPLRKTTHLQTCHDIYTITGDTRNPMTEIQTHQVGSSRSEYKKAETFQYTVMGQLYSPEILFNNPTVEVGTNLRLIGSMENNITEMWGKQIGIENRNTLIETKIKNGLSTHGGPFNPGFEIEYITGNPFDMLKLGLISEASDSDDDSLRDLCQYYRKFSNFVPASNEVNIDIYGKPELTERGQETTSYNNDSSYNYRNSLEGLLTDGIKYSDGGAYGYSIINVNDFGAKCVTFVTDDGSQDNSIDHWKRPSLEELRTQAGVVNPNSSLIMELTASPYYEYLGNIYGGNSYEEKRRSSYLEIGNYTKITPSMTTIVLEIDNPGDTFVDEFKFARMAKTDGGSAFFAGTTQYTEIVSYLTETTVDLKNRHDKSISEWDSIFQPEYTEYHDYNDVYSQQPTLVKNSDLDYSFRRVVNFDTRIQSSKLKIPNENVDSWTDILSNEIMDLDGKYGPINGLISFKDEIYTFQDEAIASISVNPRIQVQGSDGVGIELGVGGILYDYKYITTKSGSLNKWSITPTKNYIYYYDILNKGIGRLPDSTGFLLSDKKGLHSYFNNHYLYNDLKVDNPLLGKGVVIGHDNYNNDVYITLLQKGDNFTWRFNEGVDEFVDLKTYTPTRYISKGEKFLIPSVSNDNLYEQTAGDYNMFFGNIEKSYIILMVNPEADKDCVFNNIMYRSELYLNDVDLPNETLNRIQAYHEYQNSGIIPLQVGRNLNVRRKFREWKANIPRDGRERIRNSWMFLKLELVNNSNYKMILHDMTVYYSVY